jgi:hypothetical protein
MTVIMTARTARIWHTCSTCARQAIAPGHRYLLHTELPQLTVTKECIGCAQERDDFAPVLAGACASYCHGVEPCALPHRHTDDNSSCRRCIDPPAEQEGRTWTSSPSIGG